jgi:hypothetical protein
MSINGWFWQGLAMSAFEREMRAALPGDIVVSQHEVPAPALRYSSACPWVLALAISGAMWVGIGWLIWKLV